VDDLEPHAAILQAGRALLSRDRRASVAEVAAAAGVSRATVYRLFGTRARLLYELDMEPDLDSRERVLAAALELVGRDGLARLSMDELAVSAGVSRANLYRLFPGKPALFKELMRAYSPMETIVATLEELGDRPPEEVMPTLARGAVRSLQGRTGIVRTLLFEVLGGSTDSLEGVDYAFGRGAASVLRYVSEQMALGRLRPMHPLLAFISFVGPIMLHLLSRPMTDRLISFDLSLEDTAGLLAENWLRSMRPEAA
jgi:AcrR family transcriptional regulator